MKDKLQNALQRQWHTEPLTAEALQGMSVGTVLEVEYADGRHRFADRGCSEYRWADYAADDIHVNAEMAEICATRRWRVLRVIAPRQQAKPAEPPVNPTFASLQAAGLVGAIEVPTVQPTCCFCGDPVIYRDGKPLCPRCAILLRDDPELASKDLRYCHLCGAALSATRAEGYIYEGGEVCRRCYDAAEPPPCDTYDDSDAPNGYRQPGRTCPTCGRTEPPPIPAPAAEPYAWHPDVLSGKVSIVGGLVDGDMGGPWVVESAQRCKFDNQPEYTRCECRSTEREGGGLPAHYSCALEYLRPAPHDWAIGDTARVVSSSFVSNSRDMGRTFRVQKVEPAVLHGPNGMEWNWAPGDLLYIPNPAAGCAK